MQWLDDIVYTNEFLESLDKDCFPLTYKMCSKNKFDTGSVIVRKLVNQESEENRMVWVRPKSIKERYAKIAQSEWFKKAYENQSIGEVIEVEDND